MNDVQVIKANRNENRIRGRKVEILRVAAYCRVSTDSEDQLNSYKSQVMYYTDLIKKKPEWSLADIYADEAITGTQVTKREDFQRMINDCMNGDIDMVITKSISRFARNTLDTLKYVRMLKEKGIAVFFEDENINTLTMDGELRRYLKKHRRYLQKEMLIVVYIRKVRSGTNLAGNMLLAV